MSSGGGEELGRVGSRGGMESWEIGRDGELGSDERVERVERRRGGGGVGVGREWGDGRVERRRRVKS